ncbi:MAG: nucleotide exchange factor GrpE, partial [Planctomycetota bacterium]
MKWKKKTAGDQAKKKRKPAEAEEAPERQSPEEQVEELRERKPSNAEAAPEQQSPEQQSLEEQVEELRERNATLEDKLKRALADMANIRRRFGEDMRRREMEATMRIARELLPLMDSFRLARNAEADRESLLQGLGLVETMLED